MIQRTSAVRLWMFDFDGVIVDSFDVAYATLRHFVSSYTEEEYRRSFEGNIYASDLHKLIVGDNDVAEFQDPWFQVYSELLRDRKAYPGMGDVLRACAKTAPVVIVSSSVREPIEALLSREGLQGVVQAIAGSDVAQSKVEKFKLLLEQYEVAPDEVVFVTDTLGDIREANHVRIPTVAVTWGFHGRDRLAQAETVAVCDTVDELQRALGVFGATF